jgi:hemin uptake protein HemP
MAARDTERSHEMQMAERRRADREPEPARATRTVKTVSVFELLGPSGMLRIELDGEIYTLRLTRNHRLILTK